MHYHTITTLLTLIASTTFANPLHFSRRNADHSDGKCSNSQKPPCSDAPLCFYDYKPFVGTFTCHGGTPNWDYCATAIDIVCSTLAYNVSVSDNDPYQSLIGTGQPSGQGADCFAQASNGKGATSNLPYDVCVQGFQTIEGCENNKQWTSFNEDCVGGTYNLLINGLAAGNPVDDTKPRYVLGTTRAFLTDENAPQAGPAPGLKPGTSEDKGPSSRPNEGKPLATNSRGTSASLVGSGAGRAVSAGRGVYLGAG